MHNHTVAYATNPSTPAPSHFQGGSNVASIPPQAPVEQIASINEVTANNLYQARYSLDVLLEKVRGSHESADVPSEISKDRNLTSDAYLLRDFSYQILNRIEALHSAIGPNS